jgi:hypothetical protein
MVKYLSRVLYNYSIKALVRDYKERKMDANEFDPNHEHIPFGTVWTEQERYAYLRMARICPFCDVKFRYAELNKFYAAASNMQNQEDHDPEDPQFLSLAEAIASRSQELIEICVQLADQQCVANAMVYRGMMN